MPFSKIAVSTTFYLRCQRQLSSFSEIIEISLIKEKPFDYFLILVNIFSFIFKGVSWGFFTDPVCITQFVIFPMTLLTMFELSLIELEKSSSIFSSSIMRFFMLLVFDF